MKKLQKVTAEELDGLHKAGEATHAERIALLEEQAKILDSLLPEQVAGEKLELLIDETMAKLGATTKRDMGKVMGMASKKMAGRADGRAISTIVKKLLA